jgi:multidrug resistance efflux pump
VKKKLIVAGVALLLVGIAAGWYFWPFGHSRTLRFPGIVEIQEVRLGSKVGGRVAQILVDEGETVSPGQKLVIFEIPELEDQKAQLTASLEAARADLLKAENGPRVEEKQMAQDTMKSAWAVYQRLKNGFREEEKRQATADLDTAKAELVRSRKDLERIERLFQMNSASQSDVEAATAARDKAIGQVASATAKNQMYQAGSRKEDISQAYADWKKAKANHEMTMKGTRPEEIAMARARVAEAQAKLQAVETNIKEAVVIVPKELGEAKVEVLAVRPGDLVQPNQPIIRVLRIKDMWVKIFVPETQLGLIGDGKKVTVTIDTDPHRRFQGVVIQKGTIAEFTPRNVQSVDERRYQMFPIKIRVENAQGVFSAGMAAEVTVPIE